MAWVIDLDGVIWLADSPIPGSAEAISRLRQLRQWPVFLTNNSSSTVGEYLAKLEAMPQRASSTTRRWGTSSKRSDPSRKARSPGS